MGRRSDQVLTSSGKVEFNAARASASMVDTLAVVGPKRTKSVSTLLEDGGIGVLNVIGPFVWVLPNPRFQRS